MSEDIAELYRQEIRDTFAMAALEVCMAEGAFVAFQNIATDDPIWIWSIPDVEKRKLFNDGAITEERTLRDFFVPYQLSCNCGETECACSAKVLFPPCGQPATACLIGYGDWTYEMDSFDRDSVGAGWTLHMIRHLPRRTEMDEE